MSTNPDPYFDPKTGVLRNLVGARTWGELSQAEAEIGSSAMVLIQHDPPECTGDIGQLKTIHRLLFQDIYDWAGQIRTVDLRKRSPDAKPFLPSSRIEQAAQWATEQLRQQEMLVGLDQQAFIRQLSRHYDNVNYIHPFREGNGRTQRIFWSQIAYRAGWKNDWTQVTGEENDRASRVASDQRDFTLLERMFTATVTEAGTTEAIQFPGSHLPNSAEN